MYVLCRAVRQSDNVWVIMMDEPVLQTGQSCVKMKVPRRVKVLQDFLLLKIPPAVQQSRRVVALKVSTTSPQCKGAEQTSYGRTTTDQPIFLNSTMGIR